MQITDDRPKGKSKDEEEDRSISENPDLFDLAWDEYRELIGMSKKHKAPKLPKHKTSNRRRLGIISDSHGKPYMAGIAKMLSYKPDGVLVVGDVHDLQAVSRFQKELIVPIEEDVANVRVMVEAVAEQCWIELAQGNHDQRLAKWFYERIGAQYMKFVNTNMLEWAVTGIKNARVVKNMHGFKTGNGSIFKELLSTSFLIFKGDAVFGHAEISRKGELSTARALSDWYEAWRKPMMWPDAHLIGQAHTHRAGIGFANGGHRIHMELGCILEPSVIQYAMDGSAKFMPATIGFTILDQTKKNGEWVTEPNSVHFELC